MFLISTISSYCYILKKMLFTHETKREVLNIRMNRYKFVISNESSMNTNVKTDIHKLSKNIRCQFLENIMITGEITERNPNG
jgi:thioredoxin-related protein